MQTPSIKLTADVQLKADAKQPPRVSIRAYSGGLMTVGGFGLIAVDLGGMQFDGSIPLLADHENRLDSVAGTGIPEVRGGELYVEGNLAPGTPAADQVLTLHRSGVRLQASIGAEPVRQKHIEAGTTTMVNGRSVTAPEGGFTLVTRSRLREVSITPMGADATTTVSIAAKRNKKMQTVSFQEWVAECGIDTELMTSEQVASLHANYCGRSAANDSDHEAVSPMIYASSDPVAAESRRLRQIETATAGEWGDYVDQVNTLKATAIGGELSVDKLLSELRTIRMELSAAPLSHAPIASSRRDGIDGKVIEASFCLAGGLANPEKHYSEQVLDAADRMKNSVSLSQLVMTQAVKNGYDAAPGERITAGNIRKVLQAVSHTPIKATGFSTVSLPNTIANIANKFMREGFDSVDQTALRISAKKNVNNFKEHTTISLTGGMTFQPLAPGGHIQHGSVGEEVYTNQAATYAILFSITRDMLINDDADVLSAVPRKIGRGGMLRLNNLLWTLFLNNSAFFTLGRGNLVDADDLDLETLALAERAFINMVDPDGEPMGVMPSILLVPPTLRAKALGLMNSQLTIAGTTTNAMPNGNIWQGRFSVESSPYMENNNYTGSSASAFYLLASPAQVPVVEIAALNGRIEPTVETADVDFDRLGLAVRGYSDVGVAMQEYRGGVKADALET